MRLLLIVVIAFASADSVIGQAPSKMISDVGRRIETVTDHRGWSYPVFEYEGVRVSGDLSPDGYRAALNHVRSELRAREQIVDVIVTQQIRGDRQFGKDLQVRTCFERCSKGDKGRLYVFEQIEGMLRVHKVFVWVV